MKTLNLFTFILLFVPLLSYADLPAAPKPPEIAARAYVLQDFNSEHILVEKDIDARIEPASLTKLMTAYIIFEKLRKNVIRLTDMVKISEKAWRMEGSRMYIEVDTHVSVGDLLKGMIIQSGNDASVALAEYVGGTEGSFVNLMNKQAKILGLSDTYYENSTGMPGENHYSTPRDLLRMTRALIRDFPEEYKRYYSEKEFSFNNITQPNRNLLLWRDKSVDGVKTGFTENAGYCLIASAKRDNMRLISIVIGADSKKSRANESEKMLEYGFQYFEGHRLYSAKKVLDKKKVWYGAEEQVKLGLAESLYVTVPKGQYKKLKASLHTEKIIKAPVSKGKAYSLLKISLENQVIAERPLIALHSVKEGNLWQKLLDYFWLLWLKI